MASSFQFSCLGEKLFASDRLWGNTVKPAVAATSIKRDPPLSGHFRAPGTILNAKAPLLSVDLSNAASGRVISPQTLKLCPETAIFYALMWPVSIKFHRLIFLHRIDGAIKLPSSQQ